MVVSTGASPSEPSSSLSSSPDASLHDEALLENLAGRLSHHLRSLVSSIEGYTDLLNETLGSPEQRELSLRILEGTARIEGLVADLRRYAQPAAPLFCPIMPQRVVADLRALLHADQWARLQINIEAASERAFWVDPVLLRQTLLILVQNALEAAPGPPVRLSMDRTEDPDTVRFTVWNSGTIPVENAEARVFEPFFTTKPSRLGIGLAIAKRIAERHMGTLTLEANSETEGTAFALTLPQAPHDTAGPQRAD